MGKGLEGLRIFQWGSEATAGTLVAATSKMAVNDVQFDPDDKVFRPQLAKGVMVANPGNETTVTRGTTFSVPSFPIAYDELHKWLEMAFGTIAPSGVGPYTWQATRNPLGAVTPKTRTLERRLTDGTNNIDNRWGYAFLTSMTFSFKPDQPLMCAFEGVARRIKTNALTAAQNFPTIEIPPSALATVFIDSTWANLGVTQVASQILSAEVKFTAGLKPKLSLDGRADLDLTTYIIDPSVVNVEATIRMLIEANAGQFATEKAAAEAEPPTKRALRLKITGTASREIDIDCLLTHEKGSLQKIGTDEGQDIVDMKLVGATDGTNFFAVKVVNQTATNA